MSAIRNAEQSNLKRLEVLKSKNERELEHQKKLHEKVKEEIKGAQELDILGLRSEHSRQIDQEVMRKEKLFNELQTNLEKTRVLTDREINELKKQVSEARRQEFDKFNLERDRTQKENELLVQELHHKYGSKIRDVNEQGKSEVESLVLSNARKQDELRNESKNKLHRQQESFQQQFTKTNEDQRKLKLQQVKDFSNERKAVNLRQQEELKKLSDVQTQALESRDSQFKKTVKSQEADFEKKWTQTLGRHQESYSALNEVNSKAVTEVKEALARDLNMAREKSEEPFFRFHDLRPQLQQLPDRIIVKVAVPDYAKENLSLTTNGKEVIVNFHRRHEDDRREGSGTLHKLNKVETYTSRLTTDHILNPKTVKATYETGVMTYEIKRA